MGVEERTSQRRWTCHEDCQWSGFLLVQNSPCLDSPHKWRLWRVKEEREIEQHLNRPASQRQQMYLSCPSHDLDSQRHWRRRWVAMSLSACQVLAQTSLDHHCQYLRHIGAIATTWVNHWHFHHSIVHGICCGQGIQPHSGHWYQAHLTEEDNDALGMDQILHQCWHLSSFKMMHKAQCTCSSWYCPRYITPWKKGRQTQIAHKNKCPFDQIFHMQGCDTGQCQHSHSQQHWQSVQWQQVVTYWFWFLHHWSGQPCLMLHQQQHYSFCWSTRACMLQQSQGYKRMVRHQRQRNSSLADQRWWRPQAHASNQWQFFMYLMCQHVFSHHNTGCNKPRTSIPIKHGTWCAIYHDECILHWKQQKYKQMLSWDPQTNTAQFCLAGGATCYHVFTATHDASQDIETQWTCHLHHKCWC